MSDERFNQLQLEMENHVDYCERRFKERDSQFDQMMQSQTESIKAINELTLATKDMIETYNHIKGAVVIGQSIQRFGLWLIKWPLIGAGIYALIQWFHPPKL